MKEMLKNVMKKVMAVTLSAAMVLGAAVSVSAAETGSGVATARVYGDTRFTTATKVADQLKTAHGLKLYNNIVVANSDEFADALSATALAVQKKAPILVVNKNNEAGIKDYIAKNLVTGGTVYIIGGTGAVRESFEKSLKDCKVVRLGGANRYETNLKVLDELNMGNKVMVASGLAYADALSASATGNPIMLVGKSLTAEQKEYVKELGNKTYYVIGGTSAISNSVASEFKGARRLYGDTRYETGIAIAKEFFKSAKSVYIASGDAFPDGLTGGVLANKEGAPLLLVNENNTTQAADYVKSAGVKKVTAIGGTAAISDKALKSVAGIKVVDADVPGKPTYTDDGTFVLSWSGVKGADGYQVQFRSSEDANWMNYQSTEYGNVYPRDPNTGKEVQYITGTKAWWDLDTYPTWYEFRVRAYENKNGEKMFTGWSEVTRVDAPNTAASIQKAAVEYMKSKYNGNYTYYNNSDGTSTGKIENGSLTPDSPNAQYDFALDGDPYTRYDNLDRLYKSIERVCEKRFDDGYAGGYPYVETNEKGTVFVWWIY